MESVVTGSTDVQSIEIAASQWEVLDLIPALTASQPTGWASISIVLQSETEVLVGLFCFCVKTCNIAI